MTFPAFVTFAVILPFVTVASFSPITISAEALCGASSAQSSGGIWGIFVERTRRAFSPHGSIHSFSLLSVTTRRPSFSRRIAIKDFLSVFKTFHTIPGLCRSASIIPQTDVVFYSNLLILSRIFAKFTVFGRIKWTQQRTDHVGALFGYVFACVPCARRR